MRQDGGMEMYELSYQTREDGPVITRQYEDLVEALRAYGDFSLYKCYLYKLEDGERHVLRMKIWRGWE